MKTYTIATNAAAWKIEPIEQGDTWALKRKLHGNWMPVFVCKSANEAAARVGKRHTGELDWDMRLHNEADFPAGSAADQRDLD